MWLKWLSRRAQAAVVFQSFLVLYLSLILVWTLSASPESVAQAIGSLGQIAASSLLQLFGISSLLFPVYIAWNVYRIIRRPSPRPLLIRLALMFILLAASAMYFECLFPKVEVNHYPLSGLLGHDWGQFLRTHFGLVGGLILLTMSLSLCALLSGWIHLENTWIRFKITGTTVQLHFIRFWKRLTQANTDESASAVRPHLRYAEETGPYKSYRSAQGGQVLEPLWRQSRGQERSAAPTAPTIPNPHAGDHPSVTGSRPVRSPLRSTEKTQVIQSPFRDPPAETPKAEAILPMNYLTSPSLDLTDSHGILALNRQLSELKEQLRQPTQTENEPSEPTAEPTPSSKPTRKTIRTLVDPKQAFSFPLLNLMKKPARTREDSLNESQLDHLKKHVNQVLASFGVEGAIINVLNGPRLRTLEFQPHSGTKLSKLQAITDDLSVALGESNVRIVAPIPGRTTIGIEVPRKNQDLVTLRDILNDSVYQLKKLHLPVVMGKDVYGEPVLTDLADMPHLLIAGATGSGKSIFVSTLLSTLLYTKTPHELNLALVDPKMIELAHFNSIPHLIGSVMVNPEEAQSFFQEALIEMDRRYTMLHDLGSRDIDSFNKTIRSSRKNVEEKRQGKEFSWNWKPMPYVVIVVDELADLMMTQGKEVEIPLTRLAQKARACGIHLVLATQRPSHEVLTGLIKANFPSRIAFKVSASHDSRTILDQSGAEKLLGKGDMLFMTAGKDIQRIHAPFLTEDEAQAVTAHWKKQK